MGEVSCEGERVKGEAAVVGQQWIREEIEGGDEWGRQKAGKHGHGGARTHTYQTYI